MKTKQIFVIFVNDEDAARKKAMEWYANRKNLTIDSVEPYHKGGYEISISYDEKDSK